jgi:hypothetical protein
MKDIFLKIISRKFFAFVTSCWLLYVGKIDQTTWLTIAILYIGIQAGSDIYNKLKGIKKQEGSDV